MENCLVTQLKGVVVNDTLDKLGVFSFIVNAGGTQTASAIKLKVTPITGKSVTVKIKDGDTGYIWNSSSNWGNIELGRQSYTISAETDLYFSTGNYSVEISSKYNIKLLRSDDARNFHVAKAEYLINLTTFRFSNSYYTNVVKDLVNSPNATFIQTASGPRENANINTLSKLTNLANLFVQSCPNITGSVEKLTGEMYSTYGRHSGSMNIDFRDTGVKCKNTTMSSGGVVTFSSEGVTVSVGGDTYVTFDGTDWKDANGNVYVPED